MRKRISLAKQQCYWHSRFVKNPIPKSSVGKKKPLIWRLRNSLAWLDFVLEDFIDGKTQSVSGNENRLRADKGLNALRQIEKELLELFPLEGK